jgi:hypothetical protein
MIAFPILGSMPEEQKRGHFCWERPNMSVVAWRGEMG